MLIRFTVSNFRSFNEEVVFSMIPGAAQKHQEHIIVNPDSQIDVLRFAMLYGANASGKSNLIRAIDFARDFIVDGVRPKQSIPIVPFRLDKTNSERPSRFEFEFIVRNRAYAYGFTADRRIVHEEWLYVVNAKDEHALFERNNSKNIKGKTIFAKKLDSDPQFLQFVSRGTRPNELLLTKLAENNVKEFEDVYDWFRKKLTIVFPNSRHQGLEIGVYKDQEFSHSLANFLQAMNTGIDEICTEQVDIDMVDVPLDMILETWNEEDTDTDTDTDTDVELSEFEKIIVLNTTKGRYLLHRDSQNSVIAHAIRTRRHKNGNTVDFDLIEESDGTQRLLDLFPMLYSTEEKIFIVDELERSLHPNLVRNFIEQFLNTGNNNQLIVTTHESTLLDLTIFRRDEIWFVEKSPDDASNLYSLEEFKPRHDLDIRKGYLQGRFGAIPVFGNSLQASPLEA